MHKANFMKRLTTLPETLQNLKTRYIYKIRNILIYLFFSIKFINFFSNDKGIIYIII